MILSLRDLFIQLSALLAFAKAKVEVFAARPVLAGLYKYQLQFEIREYTVD